MILLLKGDAKCCGCFLHHSEKSLVASDLDKSHGNNPLCCVPSDVTEICEEVRMTTDVIVQ